MLIKNSRTFNTVNGILWGVIQKIISILLPFCTRTLLIYKLGVEYTGLGSLFNSILSVLSLAELGFGSAVVFSMYKPVKENDICKINAYINFYKKCYTKIGLLILSIGLVLLPFIKQLINGEVPQDINIYVLYIIYLINTVLSYFLFAYKTSLFNATQRVDSLHKASALQVFFVNILQLTILLICPNFYYYAIIIPMGTLINNILVEILSRKLYPEIVPKGQISAEEKNQIYTKIKGLICHQIGTVVLTSVDSIVISSYLGLEACGIYNNYYFILNAIFGFFGIVYTALLPAVGNTLQTDSVAQNYERFKYLFFLSMVMNTFCVSCFFSLIQPFIKLWVGEEMMYDIPIVFLFCVYFYFSKIGDIASVYKSALGLWDKMKYTSIVAALFNLILNIILIQCIGIYGVIISTLAAAILVYLPFYSLPVFTNYFCSVKKFIIYTLKIILCLFIEMFIAVVTYWITSFVAVDSVFSFIVKALITAFITLALIVAVYYPTGYIKKAFHSLSILKKGR